MCLSDENYKWSSWRRGIVSDEVMSLVSRMNDPSSFLYYFYP